MRLLSRESSLLPLLLLVSSALSAVAAPAPLGPSLPELDDRDLSDVLDRIGNITSEVGNILESVSDIVKNFVGIIRELKNASTENDLVDLLGMSVEGAPDDSNKTPNGSVSAVGTNITCPGMAVLFARGTTEPGNVGLFTGPSFITALRNYINGTTSLAVQGVDYPASIPGFLAGGSPAGSFVMAAIANKTAAACPGTKIVLAGYSQGAQLVHNAMDLINVASTSPPATTNNNASTTASANDTSSSTASAASSTASSAAASSTAESSKASSATATATASSTAATATATGGADNNNSTTEELPVNKRTLNLKAHLNFNRAAVTSVVSSVVLFGDPRNGTAVSGIDPARVVSFCNADDDICAKGGDIITLDHLTYNRDAPAAAMFVMQRTALGVASSDATLQGMGNVPTVPMMSGMSGAMQISGIPGVPKMM